METHERNQGLGPPCCQASVSLGSDSLFLSCHPSLLRLLLVPKTGLN